MTKEIATRPANVMRAATQAVRDHAAATQRLTDQYFAGLKRLEAQYFEGVKRITEAVNQAMAPEPAPAVNGGEGAESESDQ
jgi:hypothetical protein